MKPRNWWVGLSAGVVLGLGGVVVAEQAMTDASAASTFTVSAAQLQTNQKISQAAVKRSNRSLNYLAPIRTTQTDSADTGTKGVTPLSQITGSGKGWTSGQIADGAITESKLAAALANKLPKWAVVNTDGTLLRGSSGVTSLRVNAGNYRVDFGQDISQCSWTGVQVEVTAAQLGNIGIVADAADVKRVGVRTTDAADAAADRIFSVQVAC